MKDYHQIKQNRLINMFLSKLRCTSIGNSEKCSIIDFRVHFYSYEYIDILEYNDKTNLVAVKITKLTADILFSHGISFDKVSKDSLLHHLKSFLGNQNIELLYVQ